MLIGTHGNWHLYLLAPPASGETMVQFFHSGMFSLIHFSTAGSAYKLSTGISKNPWNTKRMVGQWRRLLSTLLFNKQTNQTDTDTNQVSKFNPQFKVKIG